MWNGVCTIRQLSTPNIVAEVGCQLGNSEKCKTRKFLRRLSSLTVRLVEIA